jgi:hypothetical protein
MSKSKKYKQKTTQFNQMRKDQRTQKYKKQKD